MRKLVSSYSGLPNAALRGQNRAGHLEELVLEQLRGRGPQAGVLLQALGDDVPHGLGEVLLSLVLERRRWVLQRHEQHLHRRELGERGVAVSHLEQRDPERPDVSRVVVPDRVVESTIFSAKRT